VVLVAGGWLGNHDRYPWTLALPVLTVVALLAVLLLRRPSLAFAASGLAVAMVVFTAGFALFPFLLPSSTDPSQGLTVWDASSSHRTLGIMLLATVILLPIVLAYSAWAFRVMRGQVTRAHIADSKEVY
jgi:cytochrome d ubiquinol oxidase subunit II